MAENDHLLREISRLRSEGRSIRNIAEFMGISRGKVERSLSIISQTCPFCGLRNIKEAKFCEQCGEQIKPTCSECGSEIRVGANFCPFCGTSVTNETSAPSRPLAYPVPMPEMQASIGISQTNGLNLFVGRQRELDDLRLSLEESLKGLGKIVMLAGEPGIGKTRTAMEVAALAEKHGAITLWGRCHETQEALPYWPWVQIIQAYSKVRDTRSLRADIGIGAADIVEIVPELKDSIPGLKPSPSPVMPDQARFRLFDSISKFLLNASVRSPLVIVLDDLHWADRPSLMLLQSLTRTIGEGRILMVGTYRDAEISRDHPLSDTLGELSREITSGGFIRLLLQGLQEDEVREFLQEGAGVTPSEKLTKSLLAQTEGNPFFLIELVRFLQQEGELVQEKLSDLIQTDMRIPDSVRDVIRNRLNRLSQRCNKILISASVIGREFSLDLLKRTSNDPSEDHILEAIGEAALAQIIEEVSNQTTTYRFTHALIQETIYGDLALPDKVRLHREIGEILEKTHHNHIDPHLPQLAHHFAESVQGGTLEKAIQYSMRAGARALYLLAFEDAIRFFEMARRTLSLKTPIDLKLQSEISVSLGEAYRRAGDVSRALAAFESASETARSINSPDDLAAAALGYENTSWRASLPGENAAALIEQALESVSDNQDILRARLMGGLARAHSFSGLHEQASFVGRRAIELARQLDAPEVLAFNLKAHQYSLSGRPDKIEELLDSAHEMLELAEKTDDKERAHEAHTWRFLCMLEKGNIKEADVSLNALSLLAEQMRQPFYLYVANSFHVLKAIMDGRFRVAETLAQQGLEMGRLLQGQDASGILGLQIFTIRRDQGRLKEIEPIVRYFVQQQSESLTWQPGLALMYCELGMEEEARELFERISSNGFSDLAHDSMRLTTITYLSEVCGTLGDSERAEILYDLLYPYADRVVITGSAVTCSGSASHYLGMLAATMGMRERTERHFNDALAMNSKIRAKPCLARTQYQYAKYLFEKIDETDSERISNLLKQSIRTADQIGMRHLKEAAESLNELVEKSHESPSYPDSLTTRQVEVLRLLASGNTNQEIADALFITLNTVANHVKNIYFKTGVGSRAEAAAYALRQDLM